MMLPEHRQLVLHLFTAQVIIKLLHSPLSLEPRASYIHPGVYRVLTRRHVCPPVNLPPLRHQLSTRCRVSSNISLL